MNRQYFSIRTGKNPNMVHYDLPILKRLFKDLYIRKLEEGCFQEYFGFTCVDQGFIPGKLGTDIDAQIIKKVRKTDLWPIINRYLSYQEEDLFDIIEFLFDHISHPLEGYNHTYNECGWHYHTFDPIKGKNDYRIEINELLIDYSDGYEINEKGEILLIGEPGLTNLLKADLPSYDPENIEKRISNAINKFRIYKSSMDERRDAIRDLADVLEYLRPKLQDILTKKDESDLFNIANNFGVRHHNEQQKNDYDKSIWYSWMFYYYLSTIHACLRLIKKAKKCAQHAAAGDPRFAIKTAQGTEASSFAPPASRGQALAKAQRENAELRL
jgi:hypothetical protein